MCRCFRIVVITGLAVWLMPLAFSEDTCQADFPMPALLVSHEKAFVESRLLLETISLNKKLIGLGITEKELNQLLGPPSTVLEEWQSRTDQQQCTYLVGLAQRNIGTSGTLNIGALRKKRMAGLFSRVQWQIPQGGDLEAYIYKSAANTAATAYLFALKLPPTSLSKIQRDKGNYFILHRTEPYKVDWDIKKNHVTIHPTEVPLIIN